jgi:hypothetical protein
MFFLLNVYSTTTIFWWFSLIQKNIFHIDAYMLNLLSTLIGLLAVISTILAFIPILGWAYWAIVPLALLGAVIGLLSEQTTGRNLNIAVVFIGIFTLFLGNTLI